VKAEKADKVERRDGRTIEEGALLAHNVQRRAESKPGGRSVVQGGK
jgi:hypothetical protein